DLLEEIQGDAHQLYFERVKLEGKTSADWKYIWDVIRFCRWSNIKPPNDEFKPGYFGILWNLNFKIALRNALSNKLVFSIKMLGLSVCLAFALVVSAFIIHEFSFDKFHKEHEQIFRVGLKVEIEGGVTNYAVSPLALAEGIVEEIPEVENAFRFMYGGKPVFIIEDNLFNSETTLIADADFTKTLSFEFLKGDKDALKEPNKIVLTKATATKFFGGADPLGKTIDLPWTQLEVAAIIKDVPANSHLKFDALISWDTYDMDEGWDNINAYTYVKLKPETNLQDFLPKINALLVDYQGEIEGNRGFDPNEKIEIQPIIQNLADIHLSEYLDEDIAEKRSKTNLYILIAVVALFFIAGFINFLNLSLAELTTNIRKFGILQVFGGATASHGKVILTNTLFSIFIILPLSTLLCCTGLVLAESYFSIYVDRSVLTSPLFGIVVAGSMVVFIFSSQINSFVLSRSNDIINALKGKVNSKQHGFQMRELLVATQLSFSIIMIALIVIIVDQFQYINSADKGFEDKNTIVIKMRSNNFSQAEAFQEAIRKLNGVKKVDGSSFYLDNIETKELFEIETREGRKKTIISYMNCGYEYLDAMGIKIRQGRNFSREHSTDNLGTYIINETAAKEFGWKDPIGKRIWGPIGTDRNEGQIIGVVKDFNFASLHAKIEPLIIFPVAEGWGIEYVYVKVDPIRPLNLISEIEREYKKSYTDLPFEWEYLDSKFQSLYKEDFEIRNIFQVGLIISISVSCLGIFSISALLVMMRAREMGIRKVIGAKETHLFILHVKTFVKFILVAVIIAWPVIYYLSSQWLDGFAYHIDLSVWYFIVPGIITLMIVLLTSGY
ncbi:MAG TPA: ABC transporter permease, partial [Chryseolinea sp.]|nr:ABC transporter permease [Chryseolinea sp.]